MSLTITADATSLIKALDRLGVVAAPHVKRAAHQTALAVQATARSRVARLTGRTAAGITVEEATKGEGYVVTPFNEAHRGRLKGAGNDEQPRNLPHWLEFGTKHMSARPYLFNAARLEEGTHARRLATALQDAIDEVSR